MHLVNRVVRSLDIGRVPLSGGLSRPSPGWGSTVEMLLRGPSGPLVCLLRLGGTLVVCTIDGCIPHYIVSWENRPWSW